MNEPVEGLEMAETKEMVSDAYRTNGSVKFFL